jgi:hypothetical protein
MSKQLRRGRRPDHDGRAVSSRIPPLTDAMTTPAADARSDADTAGYVFTFGVVLSTAEAGIAPETDAARGTRSNSLMQSCATGKHIVRATLVV